MPAHNFKPKTHIKLFSLLRPNFLTLKSIIFLIVALSFIRLYVSNNFVTDGTVIQKDTEIAQSLEEENLLLNNEIQKYSSLAYIEQQALTFGFVKVAKYEYLDTSQAVASR